MERRGHGEGSRRSDYKDLHFLVHVFLDVIRDTVWPSWCIYPCPIYFLGDFGVYHFSSVAFFFPLYASHNKFCRASVLLRVSLCVRVFFFYYFANKILLAIVIYLFKDLKNTYRSIASPSLVI